MLAYVQMLLDQHDTFSLQEHMRSICVHKRLMSELYREHCTNNMRMRPDAAAQNTELKRMRVELHAFFACEFAINLDDESTEALLCLIRMDQYESELSQYVENIRSMRALDPVVLARVVETFICDGLGINADVTQTGRK